VLASYALPNGAISRAKSRRRKPGDLVRFLNETYTISFVFAHRQGESADLRGNCPGPDIWNNIGEWAVNQLGMSDGSKGYTEGKGSPIPDSWRQPRT
jgi:hypothetical protein